MLKIDTKDSLVKLRDLNIDFSSMAIPVFAKYKPNMKELDQLSRKYKKYQNIIIIGNGGSITSFYAVYTALANYKTKKNIEFLDTMEPDYVAYVKAKFKKKDTLVLVISKSGNTIGVLENMLVFKDYKKLVITSGGALKRVAESLNLEIIDHPEIGGRYSGFTANALLPALLFGIDIKKLCSGANSMYSKCSPKKNVNNNPALKLSAVLYNLGKQGYTEIFMPVYSTRLFGFNNLIVQLIHESSCKHGKGQTIYGALAPESQHHTNQRFFGGRKNVIGLFLKIDKQEKDIRIKVGKNLKDIELRDGKLENFDNLSLSKALEYEYLGTKKDASKNRIPNMTLSIDKITEKSIGELMAFWHYVAVYSSVLRQVNPFDQPHVEESKKISFGMVKQNRNA